MLSNLVCHWKIIMIFTLRDSDTNIYCIAFYTTLYYDWCTSSIMKNYWKSSTKMINNFVIFTYWIIYEIQFIDNPNKHLPFLVSQFWFPAKRTKGTSLFQCTLLWLLVNIEHAQQQRISHCFYRKLHRLSRCNTQQSRALLRRSINGKKLWVKPKENLFFFLIL